VQGHGSTAEQSRRDGVDGYDADSYGLAVGIDTETLSNNGIFGVALSYGQTEVDSHNANRTATDVDTYQVTLYGDYDLDRATFITGMLAYSWHDVSTTRHNVGGIAGLNAHGDFDANQWTARANIGRDYQYETMTLTPSLLAHWTHYDGDNYTETGAGNAGLNVRQDSVSMFELGAGINAAWNHRTASGMEVEPSLHASYRYDFIGDEVSTTNNFIGGGAAFTANGADPAQHAFNVGAGLSLFDTSGWEFTANYDYDFKSDYDAHSGFIRAGVKF
jgi:outer membrane autotransporter protein